MYPPELLNMILKNSINKDVEHFIELCIFISNVYIEGTVEFR